MYLGRVEHKQLTQGVSVAENPPAYHIEDQPDLDMQVYSFHEAVVQSKHISDEQKAVWHTILEHEGLM